MSTFTVTPSELDELAAQMEHFTQQAQQHVDELTKAISEMHISWTGSAASAHRAAFEKQKTGLHEMNDGLSKITHAVGEAATQYRGAVAHNQKLMDEIQ